MPANFSPFPRNRTGEQEFSLLHPHGFACTGETGFYEGCIGKGADVITHQPFLALQSPQTPKQGSPRKNGSEMEERKKKDFGLYKQGIV